MKLFTQRILASVCLVTLSLSSPLMGKTSKTSHAAQEILDLKKQVKETNKKIKRLESLLSAKHPEVASQASPHSWPDRFLHIPNTNSAIRFILNTNLAVSYDVDSYTADFLFPPLLPLAGIITPAGIRPDLKKSRFNAQARGTQFGFKTLSMTDIGEVKTEVSLDFWGDASTLIPSVPAYQPRVRFAYVEVGGFTAGQTNSNFLDMDAIGETVDYGSALGASFRHGLLKYKFSFNKQTSLGLAAERPSTDYTDNQGRTIFYPSPIPASSPSFPDLTAHLKYEDKFGHVALRGVFRQLQIKDHSLTQPFTAKKNGWGLGLSGKVFLYNKSNLFGQFNFGNGVGRYIVLLNGQSSLYNATSRVFDLQKASNTIVGFEHFWNKLFRSNIIYAHTQVTVSRFTPALTGETRVTKSMNQFFLNLIYSPIEPLDVGLEYEYADRKSVDNYKGKANRFTLGITYKF